MENAFFPRTWRGNIDNVEKDELEKDAGTFDYLQVQKKFLNTIKQFIEKVFGYDKLKVSYTKKKSKHKSNLQDWSGTLIQQKNKHTSLKFEAKLFNNEYYTFNIENIPALEESRNIKIFFRVLMQYMQYYFECIQSNLPYENGILKTSENFVTKSDIWSYNIERTVIVEYLYHFFNTFDDNYENQYSYASNPLRFDIDLINSIYDFSYELSTRRVEKKEIYCGFVFHDETIQISNNSVKSIELTKHIDFGHFYQIKNCLEASNGQNIFFNVTKGKITHLFLTSNNVNEILLNPLSMDKTFTSRPLILSIQGNGKIHFLEGRPDSNKIILQIFNSKPLIQDINFIKQFIEDVISEISNVANDKKELFTKWIMSLSQKKHGTSIIFKEITPEISTKLVKTVAIKNNTGLFDNQETYKHDISILNSIVIPDGAVIFNNNLTPTNISTILPISQDSKETFGGSRHNSTANFTKKFNCVGIVISEDGFISIFKDGKRLMKF